MTEDEVRAAAERLVEFHERFAPLFGKEQAQDHAYTYVKGLMVCPERKSIEPIALNVGDGQVSALQKFINNAPWDHGDVQAEVQSVFADELVPTAVGSSIGTVGVIDESGFAKKGHHSAGVARQHNGRLGKEDNCQVGVFLVGVTPGGAAMLDHQLYLPESWCEDTEECWKRRAKVQIPETVAFQTKPQIAAGLIRRVQLRQCQGFRGKSHGFLPERAFSPNDDRAKNLKLRRILGEFGGGQTVPRHQGIASMDHATVATALLATHFAAALLPLTLRLLPVISRIGQLIVNFRAAEVTPSACHQFETQLHDALRDLGRVIVEWTYNHLEPDDRHLMPNHVRFDGDWYRRRDKTPNRGVATVFGTITLWRYLYQPIDGVERSIFPLEIRLGLAAGRATPALAECVARAAADSTQSTVLADLKRDQGVAWSVATLRDVIATTWEGMAPHLHAAQVAQVLAWLKQADESRGSRKPVLAAGRDGVFVPIRNDDSYREAATATLSVYDRAGVRLGTVYLGRMPESGQGTMSEQLTRLITDVLAGWSGPLPRLAYVTDAGHHPTTYYEQVLKPMRHPSRPGELLKWEWVIDYYHASEYIHKLSQALFHDPRRAHAWARKMCRWLKSKPRAIYRILHSAAAIRSRRLVVGQSKAYQDAYGYLRDHIQHLDYVSYRRNHLPIGSGVTEAACKTVFSQRLKRSGMAWSVEGGQRIVDLRVIQLSGVWSEVHQSYLQSKRLPETRTQEGSRKRCPKKAA